MKNGQFVVLLILNLAALAFVVYHETQIPVRVVTKTVIQTKTVTKPTTVNKCVWSEQAQTISSICNTGSNNGVKTFSISKDGKPNFQCYH